MKIIRENIIITRTNITTIPTIQKKTIKDPIKKEDFMGEMLTTSAICFAMTLIGLSLGFVLLKVTQGE